MKHSKRKRPDAFVVLAFVFVFGALLSNITVGEGVSTQAGSEWAVR